MLSFYNVLDKNDMFDNSYCSKPFQRSANMPMDVKENEKEYQVSVKVPGVNKDDVKITVEENKLTISYEQKEEVESKNEESSAAKYVFQERRSALGSRTLSFPKLADLENIRAKYNNGVLEVLVPKVPKDARVKRINIE